MLLITGGTGYIGGHLIRQADSRWRVVGTYRGRPPPREGDWFRLDVLDRAAVRGLLDRLRPQTVIHTAYRQDSPTINEDGTRHAVESCALIGARLVFTSTDLVFDGQRGPYRETDPTSPIEPYGRSKVAAEQVVLAEGGVVARTALVFGFDPLDPITSRLVVEPIQRGEPSNLFSDELRTPTYAPDLASALLELADSDFRGVIHLAGPQRLSRYDLGVKLATALGLDPSMLVPTSLASSGLVRSPDPSLDTSLAQRILRTRIRSVDQAIASVFP